MIHVLGAALLPMAWTTAITGWVSVLKVAGKSKRTLRTRRGHIESVARMIQSRSPAEVSLEHLILVLSAGDWSIEYRRGMRTSLVQFYDYCVQTGAAQENPALELPRVKEAPANPRPAPEWVWEDALKMAEPRERMMLRLAGEAGLRREEISKVGRDDVTWNGDGYSLIVQGKGGKQRIVPINAKLAEDIQRWNHPWIPQGCNTGYLFPSCDKWGNVIAPHMTADRVGRLISDLMPPGWTAHKLRHRYATKGFAGTKNLRAVQVALGHASVATTQRYTAVSEPDVRAVAEAVVTMNAPGSATAC